MRSLSASRYVVPLREGGSLPAVIETDGGGMYVVKFRGAGQGPLALVAEVLAGELARALALNVPELAAVSLDAAFGRSEPDPEIRYLLQASTGLNLGMKFLPESTTFDSAAGDTISPATASTIVWLDAFVQNVDRTARNPNLLLHKRQPWVIDHGAAFYFQHGSADFTDKAKSPFAMIRDHVLLRSATELDLAAELAHAVLTPQVLQGIVAQVPNDWLVAAGSTETVEHRRSAYLSYFINRLECATIFQAEAQRAHDAQL